MSVFVPTTLENRVKKLEAEIKILRRQIAELRRSQQGKPTASVEEDDDESCSIT
jgi:hypothetical protein